MHYNVGCFTKQQLVGMLLMGPDVSACRFNRCHGKLYTELLLPLTVKSSESISSS
jgi:hypothetical protein